MSRDKSKNYYFKFFDFSLNKTNAESTESAFNCWQFLIQCRNPVYIKRISVRNYEMNNNVITIFLVITITTIKC